MANAGSLWPTGRRFRRLTTCTISPAHKCRSSARRSRSCRARLAPTRAVDYTARDGTHLCGYLTTPITGAGPYRTVILPHGGPQSRDSFGYDETVQFLAARGYAVFQPNFRGSEGSGRSFTEAGFHQWGRLMQDDITDGVRNLIDSGVADANKICIV